MPRKQLINPKSTLGSARGNTHENNPKEFETEHKDRKLI